MSSTVCGLQRLISKANNYVKTHGIKFNASKTKCAIFGKSYLTHKPVWKLSGEHLSITDHIEYLGAILSNKASDHKDNRIKACRTKFHMAKHAGMHGNGIKPKIVAYLWRTAIQPALVYGAECLPLSERDKREMDRTQAKLIKCALGLSKYLRNTALLQALQIRNCVTIIDCNTINLLSSICNGTSQLKTLYLYMLNHPRKTINCDNLLLRGERICRNNSFSFFKCTILPDYLKKCKKDLFVNPTSGLVDSLKMLLSTYNQSDKELINLLLSPF